jgi:predicted RNase H-like HicB family nuclease
MAKNYIALFEQGEKGGYSVVFPDMPGVATAADDFNETVRMAHEVLSFHVDGLLSDGDTVPEPRSLEKIKAEWEDWSEWESDGDFLIVPIALLPPPQKSIRVDVMLPERLVARIDAASKNRSAFLSRAAEYMLSGEDDYKRLHA